MDSEYNPVHLILNEKGQTDRAFKDYCRY